jgi:hypothetical protein
MAHEIHQYYFEKYLRNEMSIRDKLNFEEKLAADTMLRSSFEHYKLNRQEYLSDFAIIQQKKASNLRLNSWIYLLISIIGILVSINLYLDNQALKSQQNNMAGESIPFYKRIPFLFGSRTEKKSVSPPTGQKETAIDSVSSTPDSIPVPEEGILFDQDELITDTEFRVFEKALFDQHYEQLRASADSLNSDSILELLTIKSFDGTEHDRQTSSVEVEFWRSPIAYVGYKFNGHKIIIYGYDQPFKLTLLRINESLGIRQDEGNIYTLINDNNFHRF